MRTVGTYEVRTHLSQLLDEVAKGETITKRGVPVAKLVPPDGPQQSVQNAIASIRELRRGITLGDMSLRELIEEGRHI